MCVGIAVTLEKSRRDWEGALSRKRNAPVWGGSMRSIVHFEISLNEPPKSIDLNRWKTNRSLDQMEWIGLLVNAQLYSNTRSIYRRML
ncbi:hypothetical protein AVEN_31674-1 [Araneus ventricosus]|uniref:Uncharacterized protein n=1 Tax=Araneus ventricosus TaxID=182803 RepID=A0A4Y2QSY4_ARAVE|nr:hypothetical protein AVEN_31674-1 [Araneus ventricosus]